MFTISNTSRLNSVLVILGMLFSLTQSSPAHAATIIIDKNLTLDGLGQRVTFIGEAPAFAADVMTIAGIGSAGFSGDGSPAIAAQLSSPHGMAVAADGTVYIADTDNFRVRRISTGGVINTIAGTGLFGDDGDGGQATSASISGVLSIALSPAGDILYISDIDNNRVRQVNLSTGVITNFAGLGWAGFGFDGDGGPATSASLASPEGVAVDASGNVYIGDLFNCVVRKVDVVTNIITTVAGMPGLCSPSGDGGDALAAQFSLPRRMALDPSGNLFVLDSGSRTVRRVDATTNVITTIAGGGSTTPGFGDATTMDIGAPSDLVLDAANNLYISTFNQVFKVDLGTGILSVFAGTGVNGYSGDGGPAQDATFFDIGGVTTRADEILIADSDNNRIRTVVSPAPPPDDLIIGLTTSQAFLDALNAVAGSILMINVDGRELLIVPNATSVGLDVTLTDNDQLIVIDLAALASAGGNITISGNLALQSVDLSGLTTVGGSLTVTNNPALNVILISGATSIGGDLTVIGTAATVIDMSSLTIVTGSLDVSDNTSATAINMGSLTGVGGNLTVTGNSAADPINMSSLTTVGGDLDLSGNTSVGAIDLGGLTAVGGSLTIDGSNSATSIDMGSLTTVGGSLSISNNPAANPIDMTSLTTVSGGLTISDNISVGGLDLSGLTSAGSVDISGNTSTSAIDMSGLTSVNGDLTVVDNGGAAVDLATGAAVGGSVTIETTGTGAFPMGGTSVAGDLTLDANGYTGISGTTPAGALDLTATNFDALMHLQIQAASFTTPVTFSITRIDPIALVPEGGLDANGSPAMIDPVAAYQFTFAIPTLNRDAALSFDIDVAQLDAATQTAFLDALAAGTATMVTKGDAVGSVFQAFPVCSGASVPTVDGCVKVELFDALGQPTSGTPAIVRFSNVVGHFSTWSVATVTTTMPQADLSVTKSDDVDPIIEGGNLTYTIMVTNNGPDAAENVTVSDTLPAGTTFNFASQSKGTCAISYPSYNCQIGTLQAGESATMVVHIRPDAPGVIANTVSAASSTVDPDTSNNSDSENTTVTPLQADLSVTKSDDIDPIIEGGNLTYTIVVTNNGPDAAENVTVSDTLPAGTTFNFASQSKGTCAISYPLYHCQIGTLQAGESATMVVHIRPDAPGVITNTVSAASSTVDPDTSNNSDSENTTVTPLQADLSVTKSDNIDPIIEGGDLTYTIVVTNNGPDAAENVTLEDTLPAGTTFNFASQSKGTCAISYPSYNCQIGTLQAGESATMVVHIRPDAPGVITNNVSVASSTVDPDTSNNSDGEDTTVYVLQADLSVTKGDDVDPVTEGEPLTYTIVVTNNGPDAAENVIVSDTLPAGTSFEFATITQGTCAIGFPLLQCQIGTMDAGETVTLTVRVEPNAPGVITNNVSVTSDTDDPDPSNNSDGEDTTVNALQADLSVAKSDDVDPVTEGEPLTYMIMVTNNGPHEAENVILSDTLPTGASFKFATITQGTCAIGFPLLQCQIGTINAGGTVTLTIRVEPSSPGVITNTVSVASDTNDPNTSNNSDSEVTTVNGIPTVTVINGQCSATNLASGTINLALYDVDEDPLSLTLASNTNTTLIPNSNIVLGGSGNNRTMSVTAKPKKSGAAILTFNLSDGIVTIPFTITVKVGTDKDDVLNGTAGTDMIFGLNGKNTINGFGGNDLLCGGNGVDTISGGDGNDIIEGQNGNDILNGGNDNDILRGNLGDDMLTGSAGADFFSGDAGTDTAADFNASQGDTQDGTIP